MKSVRQEINSGQTNLSEARNNAPGYGHAPAIRMLNMCQCENEWTSFLRDFEQMNHRRAEVDTTNPADD